MEERRTQQREAARERQRSRRQRLREEERQSIRDRNRQRTQQQRRNMSQDERELHLDHLRNRDHVRRNNMNMEERQQFLENMRNRDHVRRNNMNMEERQQFRENMRNRDHVRRNNMNQQERQNHLENERNRVQRHRNAHTMERQIYYIGAMDVQCQFCRALRFQREQLNCCHNGKVMLPPLQDYPENLRLLFDANNAESANFRQNIRNYNSAFAFASFGANIRPPPGRGPYCFRLQGQTYHYASNLHANDPEERRYGQLYIIETNKAIHNRVNAPENANCLVSVFQKINEALINNPYAAAYHNMRDIEQQEQERAAIENVSPRQVTMHFIPGPDRRRYNNPSGNEIAAIFVGDDGAPPVHRDIIVYPIGQQRERIAYISCHLDPMVYPLLFPNGESGWHIQMAHVAQRQTRVRTKVSMQEFYSYRLAIRDGFSALHRAGKLLQQYIVDAYVKVEGCRLNFIQNNQAQLRVALYSGLMDHLGRQNEHQEAGVPVILPSTFTGSPRNMQQAYQDAMAIVCKFGKPDLFLTYTCNPKCREITENLGPHETTQNRPDLVARVYNMHLKELLIDIKDRHIFGVPVAHIYVIEFQKRGLPHCHLLLMLREEDKLRTREQIDEMVCAEIPSLDYPELRECVRTLMIHGPCGISNPNSVCMVDGTCEKKFPKDFLEETITNVSGYPVYRRKNNGEKVQVGTHEVDNRFVVPYNKYLLEKYRAHINVEVCSSVKSVKYLFKYIYKGHDCANMEIRHVLDNNEPTGIHEHNEVKQFLSCRYVSPPEGFWRLSEFKMHAQSHTVYRLAVHLPDEQHVYYREGNQRQAAARAEERDTQLTAWFKLNQTDENARNLFYCSVPEHYVFNKQTRKWTRRIRFSNILTRMYSASPRNEEKFYLRMLLLHVPGATSFSDLKTIDGQEMATFKEACLRLRLVENDNALQEALTEAAAHQMPRQLLSMFSMMCVFNQPVNALHLWNENKHFMIEDLLLRYDNITAENVALHFLNTLFMENGMNCNMFGLPEPVGDHPGHEGDVGNFNIDVTSLNIEQRQIFNAVVASAFSVEQGEQTENRLFYVDAPGGSGKTYLFNKLYEYLNANNIKTNTSAWTGIAATLLTCGKTLHSIFKLPVPLSETSVCHVPPNSEQGNFLMQVKVFIIDEASMIPCYALKAIDKCLKDIMNTHTAFGGKVILLGGDFRQVLPVVPRAPPAAVLDVCLKRSDIWHSFHHMSLTQNMRANSNEQEFSRWLLQMGNGSLQSSLDEVAPDVIDIPEMCTCNGSLISDVFDNCTAEEMKARVILSPKNSECLAVNEEILRKLPTENKTYLSTDSVSCDNDEEAQNYPMEFINSLTPSGMPPHRLNLKIGAIIMLLRNLSITQGLCNGTRLDVIQLHEHSIEASIISGSHAHKRVLIPRIKLKPSDANIPFVLHRTQFPVRLSYSMTINKAQGQTFDRVGIYLPKPCFTHGQLYVAFSRARAMKTVRVKVQHLNDSTHGHRRGITFTRNIVYTEVI